jgi:hypothetical protein
MRLPPVLCGGLLFALCGVAGQTLDARSVAPLAVILIADSRVSPTARQTLIEEATRIWDAAGVRLEWTSPLGAAPSARDTLRMLAVARPAMQAPANPMILGELLRPESARALALVSLRDAERIAARGDGWRSRMLRDRQIGLVLGRAAAHEIGHYLLNTSTHADEGLMRARFDEIEFTNPQSDAFELDAAQRDWVRQRLSAGLPLGPDAHLE